MARVWVDSYGQRITADAASGYGATDLASAYNLDTSVDPGATIAIIDAYGYSSLESDLTSYRSQYGLPSCTTSNGCLKIVNQSGQTSPLPSNPPSNDDWTTETALDVDMASAACPKCKIIVVQADDDQGDGLMVANNTAASLHATVISNSWGGPESSFTLPSSDSYFDHAGIAVFVSAGDAGYDDGGQGPDFPATSEHVIAVGGTNLQQGGGSRGWSETAWSSGGSACSQNIAKPSWQTSTACAMRMSSDVAAVGDPNTGVAVYNGGWQVVGGTSAASPLVAGIFALTKNGSKTAQFAYQHTAAFNDVTSGNNGSCGNVVCNAGAGWDGPTGVGTPDGAKLAALGGGGNGSGSGGGGGGSGSGSGIGSGGGSNTGSGTGSDTGSDTGSNGGGGGGGGGGGSNGDNPGNGNGDGTQGGCSTTGGSADLSIVLALGIVIVRRRRSPSN